MQALALGLGLGLGLGIPLIGICLYAAFRHQEKKKPRPPFPPQVMSRTSVPETSTRKLSCL